MNSYGPTRSPAELAFKKAKIKHPQLVSAHKRIERVHRTHGINPECLMILGYSYVGKSKTLQSYIDKYPPVVTNEYTHFPVIYIDLSVSVTPKDITLKIFKTLGINRSSKSPTLFDDLCEQLKNCRVELLIFDEIQQVLPEHAGKMLQQIADYFKSILNQSPTAIVFAGLPHSEKLYEVNETKHAKTRSSNKTREGEQLVNRSRPSFVLTPYPYDSDEWKHLLHIYQKAINIPCINLDSDNIAERLWVASAGGVMGRLSKILVEAIKIAGEDQGRVSLEVLSEAYDETNVWNNPSLGNPFSLSRSKLDQWLLQDVKTNATD